ncbi:hypothetical protein AB9K35_16950 [Leisingera sp. XS_AS12]|uniref:hypothetical protein n=1 Tax=Leisingera sp. XS_AS12 TaxID=3241294 RepID=UPI0035151C9E
MSRLFLVRLTIVLFLQSFAISAAASTAVCESLAQKAVEEFTSFGEHNLQRATESVHTIVISYPDHVVGRVIISFMDFSPTANRELLEIVSVKLFERSPYGQPGDDRVVQLRQSGIADPENGVSHMSRIPVNKSELIVISDWSAVRTCAVQITIMSYEDKLETESAIFSISEALRRR